MVTVWPIASSVALFSQVSLTLCEGMLLCLAEISLFTCTDLFFSSLAMSVSDISGDILLMTITKSEVGLFRASRKVALPNFSFSRRLRLWSSAGKRSGSFPAVLLRPLITMLCPSFSRFFSHFLVGKVTFIVVWNGSRKCKRNNKH